MFKVISESDPSWTQSTLPVRHGGLGIRSAVQLAPSAFLASAAASSGLAHLILPANMQPPQLSYVDEALAAYYTKLLRHFLPSSLLMININAQFIFFVLQKLIALILYFTYHNNVPLCQKSL